MKSSPVLSLFRLNLVVIVAMAMALLCVVLVGAASVDQEARDVHVVFSTDCSAYQHWQALLLFHSAQTARHRGTITRILCGCDAASRARIAKTHARLFPHSPFRLHFAPDYSRTHVSNNSDNDNNNNKYTTTSTKANQSCALREQTSYE